MKAPTASVFKNRGLVDWALRGRRTAFTTPAKGVDPIIAKSKNATYSYVGRGSGSGDAQHVFKTNDGKYFRYSGDQDITGKLGKGSRGTQKGDDLAKEITSNSSQLSDKDVKYVNSAMKDNLRSKEGLGQLAYGANVTGGTLGHLARSPIRSAAAAGAVLAVGEAGRRSYQDVRKTNTNRPSTWGIGQNTSVSGDLQKMSSIDSFVAEKTAAAGQLGSYLLADAATDSIKGDGNSRGVLSGVGYTLSRNLMPLSTRIQMPDTMAESFVTSMSSDAGKATFDALNKAMQGVFGRMKERNVEVPKRRLILKMVKKDPVLQGIPENDLKSWYNTLASYAPNISLDKNMVSSFLKQVAQYDGQIDYGRLKELMDLEKSYQEVHLKSSGK